MFRIGETKYNSGYTLELNEKITLTLIRVNNTIQFWVNGEKVLEDDATNMSIYQTNTILGRWGAYDNRYFNGVIYSIRKYNKALTIDEIQQNYNVDKMRF